MERLFVGIVELINDQLPGLLKMTIPIPTETESTLDANSLALILENEQETLPRRFRALFALCSLCNDFAVNSIGRCFKDKSALLKHELAYVLGQMRLPSALPILKDVLYDKEQEAMVRHEAAEAMGAIGSPSSLPFLKEHLNDFEVSVRETCEIAIDLIEKNENLYNTGAIEFSSVDPAPPMEEDMSVSSLSLQLMNTSLTLYYRYKALFTLRNKGSRDIKAVLAICSGFSDKSALFRHEIAYVLGQLQSPSSIPALKMQLSLLDEVSMVRHECAEALGSISTPECFDILNSFLNDPEDVVRESCVVALDMLNYENSDSLSLL